jgi:hypothetical protein
MGDTKQVTLIKRVWFIWVLLGLFFACKLYVEGAVVGRPVTFTSAFLLAQVNAHLYFLATLPAWFLAERFQPRRGKLFAHALLHAPASVVFSAVVLTVYTTFQLWFYSGAVTRSGVVAAVFDKLNEGVYVYWLAVLGFYAHAHYAGCRRDALQPPPPDAGPVPEVPMTLRAQLQPHFLFNTLNTIATLMREDIDAAEAMLIHMSAYLRGTLSESQEVPLRFELDTLRGYLHMQAARFGDLMSVRIDVDPAAERALVPNMLLQPLAEDAFKHGDTRAASAGLIEVEARREGEWLRILVSDDCGGDDANEPSPRQGDGLTKTVALLSRLYGPSHRFGAEYRPGAGFLIDIKIPFRVREPAGGRFDEVEMRDRHGPHPG